MQDDIFLRKCCFCDWGISGKILNVFITSSETAFLLDNLFITVFFTYFILQDLD